MRHRSSCPRAGRRTWPHRVEHTREERDRDRGRGGVSVPIITWPLRVTHAGCTAHTKFRICCRERSSGHTSHTRRLIACASESGEEGHAPTRLRPSEADQLVDIAVRGDIDVPDTQDHVHRAVGVGDGDVVQVHHPFVCGNVLPRHNGPRWWWQHAARCQTHEHHARAGRALSPTNKSIASDAVAWGAIVLKAALWQHSGGAATG